MQHAKNCSEETILPDDSEQPSEPEYESKAKGLLRKRGGKLYWKTKRVCDVVISIMLLIVLSPAFLIISLLIVLSSEGAAIYCHDRIGKNGKPIGVLKFRTMVKDADMYLPFFSMEQKQEWSDRFKLDHDPRVTPIGRFLRKSSLDELPQLINIIKGEMSLVGPRPIVKEELEKYGSRKAEFLSITPGLTGYWQAYARSDCDYERRMQMELEYVNHANFLWDIQILLVTCKSVLQGKGAQ